MGLTGGDHGAKAVVLHRFEDAWEKIRSLRLIGSSLNARPEQTCLVLDGNVALMSAPSSVDTLEQYVSFLSWQINLAFEAADHVILCFDEPENLTVAKRAEQAKRDKARKKTVVVTSEDLPSLPTTDNYNTGELPLNFSARAVFSARGARSRVIDEICVKTMDVWLKKLGERTLTMDGVDARGGARSSSRAPDIFSSSEGVAAELRRDTPVGEGDLKLTAVSNAIEAARHHESSPFKDIELVILSTIDTDSIPIELVAHAERNSRGVEDFLVILALKERSSKRKETDHVVESYYSAIDIECLFSCLVDHLFGRRCEDVPAPLRRKAITLFALGCVLCGCDFLSDLKGLRFDEMLSIMRTVCHDAPHCLAGLDGAWGDDDDALMRVAAVVKDLIDRNAELIEEQPRRNKHCASLREPPPQEVLKALWTIAYWHEKERKAVREWGFCF